MTRLIAILGLAALMPEATICAMDPTSALSEGRNAVAERGPQRPRVVVFFEHGFPTSDAAPLAEEDVRAALSDCDLSVMDAAALPAALDGKAVDVLVMPFGSAFPQNAWPAIQRYLLRGGNLVNLGGVPFAQPAVRDANGWKRARRTTSFHRQLGIIQAFPVDASGLVYRPARPAEIAEPVSLPASDSRGATYDEQSARLAGETPARRIHELIVRLTSVKAFPDEDGSDGPREARLDALVYAYRPSTSGARATNGLDLPLAAPFVQIDRLQGSYAGGRWVLATGEASVSRDAIAVLVARAAAGPVSMRVQPHYAGFHPDEPITIDVFLDRPGRTLVDDVATCELTVSDRSGQVVARATGRLAIDGSQAAGEFTVPVGSKGLARGLYTVSAVAGGVRAGNGFWVYDGAMVRGGRALTAGRDYFTRLGQPFPVAGTTYMATDVHRRFLLEPNPAAWARDFVQLAAAGVNAIRTGIWTGWRLHAAGDGTPTESMLRALEVFLLTARERDMPVIFNLFAFVPPTWDAGRVNPYFAPAALAAQRRFAGGIAARLAGADDVIWDLINEPSFSSPDRLWSCRPNYDADEQAAWEAWIRESVGPGAASTSLEAAVLDRWNGLPEEGLALPKLEDFGDKNLFGTTRPNKAADYKRFAQASFIRWVRDISAAIRANGNRAQLITVGQDEGGATERPNPLLFGEAVDFTGTHTWWNNDALLWDALVSRRPDRPSLIGETGLMTYERPDGDAWRNEIEAHNLLERKLALSFAGGGAGFVQWLWNTNVYMPIDNEAGIGLLRADGTAKPEFAAFAHLTSFVARHRASFQGRVPEDVVVVIPQSQLFSVRDFAAVATQRAVLAFEYELRTPVRVLSEYATEELKKGARLVVVPSPRTLTDAAWNALLAAADAGATVLLTGPFDRDEYERATARLEALGVSAVTRPVAPVNSLKVGSVKLAVPFRGNKLERVERGVIASGRVPLTADERASTVASLVTIARSKGRVVWCPLPVELADADAAILAVYREALRVATVRPARVVAPAGVLVRPLVFDRVTLFVAVNESDVDATVVLRGGAKQPGPSVRVGAGRATMVLVDRRTGQILDSSQ